MLRWYRKQGYRIVPLIAPLPGEELPPEGIEQIAAELGNIIQVHRDGTVEYILHDLPDVVASLNGTFTPSFTDLLEEEVDAGPRERELLAMERTFCHDAVISTVLHLERSLGPHILQVEYIWMTRLLPLVRSMVLKVVDTIDVLSSNLQKVGAFGVGDVVVEPDEEAARLRRADLVIAIQDDERVALTQIVPTIPVITTGVDFDLVDDGASSAKPWILNVASNNPRNRKGLQDFLRLAWPRIRDRVPNAELLVVGSVARAIENRDLTGVRVAGPVDDLTALYRDAALVINPAVAGTGLKIKTLEALCHLRPVVTWPSGVEGLDPKLAALCLVAHDWYEFSERVIEVLTSTPIRSFSAEEAAAIAGLVASERVYASVDSAYRAFFDQHRPATTSPGVSRQGGAKPMVTHACD
jgi:glycosyltransferase involved in cell wall biosynthesis